MKREIIIATLTSNPIPYITLERFLEPYGMQPTKTSSDPHPTQLSLKTPNWEVRVSSFECDWAKISRIGLIGPAYRLAFHLSVGSDIDTNVANLLDVLSNGLGEDLQITVDDGDPTTVGEEILRYSSDADEDQLETRVG